MGGGALEHAVTQGLVLQNIKCSDMWQLQVWGLEGECDVVICWLSPLESTALTTV